MMRQPSIINWRWHFMKVFVAIILAEENLILENGQVIWGASLKMINVQLNRFSILLRGRSNTISGGQLSYPLRLSKKLGSDGGVN